MTAAVMVGAQVVAHVSGEVMKVRRALGSRADGRPVSMVLRTDDGTTVTVPLLSGVVVQPVLGTSPWATTDVVEGPGHTLVRAEAAWLCSCGSEHTDTAVTADVATGRLRPLRVAGHLVAS